MDSIYTRVNISIVDEKMTIVYIPYIAVTLHFESTLDFLLLGEKVKRRRSIIHADRLE
jgi:hypothetical protein